MDGQIEKMNRYLAEQRKKELKSERNRRYYLKHRDEIRENRRERYYLTGE